MQSQKQKASSSKSRRHRGTSSERSITWQQEAENVLQMIVDSPDSVPFRSAVNIEDFPVCNIAAVYYWCFKHTSLSKPFYVTCSLTVWLIINSNNNINVAHTCHYRSPVDTHGLHGLACKKAPSKTTRHHAINDVITRSLIAAGVPVTKEPCGLTRTDGKRPDGLTLAGKPLTWDVMV